MGIPISGVSRETYENTKTTANTTKPFPYVIGKWVNHYARVTRVELKHDTLNRPQLEIHYENGDYAARQWVGLDVNDIPPNSTDRVKSVERNIDRLTKVAKALGIASYRGHTMEIEPDLFPRAVGRIVVLGFNWDGKKKSPKGYPRPDMSFSGIAEVQELRPVEVPAGAVEPSSSAAAVGSRPYGTPPADGFGDDDIPF